MKKLLSLFLLTFVANISFARSKQLPLVTCKNEAQKRSYSLYCSQDYSSSLGEFLGTYSCQIEGNSPVGEEGMNVSVNYTDLSSTSIQGTTFGSLAESEVDVTLYLLRSLLVDKEDQIIQGSGTRQIEESVSTVKATLMLNQFDPANPQQKKNYIVEGSNRPIEADCKYLE